MEERQVVGTFWVLGATKLSLSPPELAFPPGMILKPHAAQACGGVHPALGPSARGL